MKPYFYLLNVSRHHEASRHGTLDEAHAEAMDQATKNPGRVIEILQCVGITHRSETHTFWMDGVKPPATKTESKKKNTPKTKTK